MPRNMFDYQTLSQLSAHDVFKVVNTSLADGCSCLAYPCYPRYQTTEDPDWISMADLDSRPSSI